MLSYFVSIFYWETVDWDEKDLLQVLPGQEYQPLIIHSKINKQHNPINIR